VGQGYELKIPLAVSVIGKRELEEIWKRFHEAHEREYGHAFPSNPIEIVNVRVIGVGQMPKITKLAAPEGATTVSIFRSLSSSWSHGHVGLLILDQGVNMDGKLDAPPRNEHDALDDLLAVFVDDVLDDYLFPPSSDVGSGRHHELAECSRLPRNDETVLHDVTKNHLRDSAFHLVLGSSF
jgi:hypothetical protein